MGDEVALVPRVQDRSVRTPGECTQKLFIDLKSLGLTRGEQLKVDVTDIAEAIRNDKHWLLVCCLIVDIIGCMSYLILFLGELTDVYWAPMSGFFMHYMFGSKMLTAFGSLEEIIPFTDWMPSATMTWCFAHVAFFAPIRSLF